MVGENLLDQKLEQQSCIQKEKKIIEKNFYSFLVSFWWGQEEGEIFKYASEKNERLNITNAN